MSDDTAATEPPHVENEGRFASIPEALLYDPTISADAVRVYGVLRRHGNDPQNCYPSHHRIAGFVGASARSVPRWIRQLEDAGWVTRVPRKSASGDPDSNAYVVHFRAVQRGVRAGERRPSTQDSGEGCALESAPKESNVEREQLNDSRAVALGSAFDEFWQTYPLKRDKPAALKAWNRAVKRAEPSFIITAAQRYALDPGRSSEFTKYPATWLNNDCWNDPPLPARTDSRNGVEQSHAAIAKALL